MLKIKSINRRVIALIAVVVLIAFIGTVFADRGVPALPEIQGLATSTGMNVQGTITETDSGAWNLNSGGIPISGDDPLLAKYPNWASYPFGGTYQDWLQQYHTDLSVFPGQHLQDYLQWYIRNVPVKAAFSQDLLNWLQNQGAPLTPPLEDNEVQYTIGYNDQTMAVSGQSTFAKTVAVSTGNTIADQSNVKADTSLQFIAIDAGRATRTEDLLIDGASQATNGANAILCPFAESNPSVIPAYCNIGQAGSSIDTTLTSVVTSANIRFVGTDATIPTVLNYNINVEGLTAGGQSSPMIGSVSAYLKVHVQEARNISTTTEPNRPDIIVALNPQKSEDLVYSETSSASGLITKFSKSMSYSSQASAVPVAIPPLRID